MQLPFKAVSCPSVRNLNHANPSYASEIVFSPESVQSVFLQLLSLELVPGNSASSLVDPHSDSHVPPSLIWLSWQAASHLSGFVVFPQENGHLLTARTF